MIALKKVLERINTISVSGNHNQYLSDIQYDSRKTAANHAFFAIKGYQTDGHRFIDQAYKKGARVFFVEDEIDLPKNSTVIRVSNTRQALAETARIFFEFPDRKLKITGITGTDGKTTTAYLIFSILKSAHWRPGLITTVEYFDGRTREFAERTTPESLDLFRLLSNMVRTGLKSAVMEVSSHALSMDRVYGISFSAGVFTNFGRDHLDFHRTMGNYFSAKLKLFQNFNENQKVVLNEDIPYSGKIKKNTEGEIFTYSFYSESATVKLLAYQSNPEGMQVKLKIPSGKIRLQNSLLGKFNIYNIMAAVCTAVSLGIGENFIIEGINNLKKIPGRCEYFSAQDGYAIYIDYAHTPQGLKNILHAIWETKPNNLIVVFGAGGDRDAGKRPEMGKEAENFADCIILTDDNPRSETPVNIINEILAGIFDKKKVKIIQNRREAIFSALNIAKKRDAVLIAGKGHESFQEYAGKKIPFNDHLVLKDYFTAKGWDMKN